MSPVTYLFAAAALCLSCLLIVACPQPPADGPLLCQTPSVTGMSLKEAQAALSDTGLSWEVVEEPIQGLSSGYVAAQDPGPGALLAEGGAVRLTLAVPLRLPALQGRVAIAPAEPAFDDPAGALVSIVNAGEGPASAFAWELLLDGASVKTGRVDGLEPAASYRTTAPLGELAGGRHSLELFVDPRDELAEAEGTHEDARLTFWVKQDMRTVPWVTGMTPGKAQQALTEAGLTWTSEEEHTMDAGVPYVGDQDPPGDEKLPAGSAVALTIYLPPNLPALGGEVTIVPEAPVPGDAVRAEISITNGGADSGPFSWELLLDGSPVGTGRVQALRAHRMHTAAVELGPLGPGTYELELTVDAANQVEEMDGGHMDGSLTFIIGELTITTIAPLQGSVWHAGSQAAVWWTAESSSDHALKLELQDSGGYSDPLASEYYKTGTHRTEINVSPQLAEGDGYRIIFRRGRDGPVVGRSEPFRITHQPWHRESKCLGNNDMRTSALYAAAAAPEGGVVCAGYEMGGDGYPKAWGPGWDRDIDDHMGEGGRHGDDETYLAVAPTPQGGFAYAGRSGASSHPETGHDIRLRRKDAMSSPPLWTTIDGGAHEWANDIALAQDGAYYLAGVSSSEGNMDFLVAKADPEGAKVWLKTFGGEAHDSGWAVAAMPGGGCLAAGVTASSGSGGEDIYLVELDAGGNEVWSTTLGGVDDDWAYGLRLTPDGGCVVTGGTRSEGAGGSDAYLVKLDANRAVEWTAAFGGEGDDEARDVILTDGDYLLAGATDSFGEGGSNGYVVRVSPQGEEKMSATFGANGDDLFHGLAETTDGRYVFAGETNSYGFSEGVGYVVWARHIDLRPSQRTFGTPNLEEPTDVISTSDGGYAVLSKWAFKYAPTPYGGSYVNDTALLKVNSALEQEWLVIHNNDWSEYPSYLRQTADGGYVYGVASRDHGLNSHTTATVIKTGPEGEEEWSLPLGAADFASDCLVVARKGGGYMAVYDRQKGITVARLSAEGALLGQDSYKGDGRTYIAAAVDTDDDGLFVVGATIHPGASDHAPWRPYLLKFDAVGTLEWERKLPEGHRLWTAQDAVQTPDGGYIALDSDFALVKLDASGAVEWTRQHDWEDAPKAISVCVAGSGGYLAVGAGRLNYQEGPRLTCAVRYDASGNILWTKQYGIGAGDWPAVIRPAHGTGYVLAGFTSNLGRYVGDLWLMRFDAEGETPPTP